LLLLSSMSELCHASTLGDSVAVRVTTDSGVVGTRAIRIALGPVMGSTMATTCALRTKGRSALTHASAYSLLHARLVLRSLLRDV